MTTSPMHQTLTEATALHQAGRLTEAEATYLQLLLAEPGHAGIRHLLGLVLHQQGRTAEALPHLEGAARSLPHLAEVHLHHGIALRTLGRSDQAAACHRRAIDANPDLAEAYLSLGNALDDQGLVAQAARAWSQALRRDPNQAEAAHALANALANLGRFDEAQAAYRHALTLRPDPATWSDYLLCLHYVPGLAPDAIAAAHFEYGRQLAPLAEGVHHANDRSPERCLRVGYLSTSFTTHSLAGYFCRDVLLGHDPRRIQMVCYSGGAIDHGQVVPPDALVRRIGGLDDEALVAQIRADAIDVLVDLDGHMHGNRLPALARKPAPVQLTWAGYPDTTGLAAIDALITDSWQTPLGTEALHSERLLRLGCPYIAYAPPLDAPLPLPPPLLERRHVTFGCLNKLAKINPEVVALWARLLHAMPDACLLLKARPLADADVRAMYQARFAAHGITAERLSLEGGAPHRELMAAYNEIDVALDPFPYSGGITTLEALWMGVPVVTLGGGRTMAARHSLGHLNALGLDDWIAGSPDDYLAIAVRLAEDPNLLGFLRRELRPMMMASPLCAWPRLVATLEEAYRMLWRRWLASAA
ncbi:MAG: tetratricopeptide repeat protein [Rhodospirillales bacterium]|nr:tetratricopeptide repeat protein [Rhodospirillales bacterium]